ERAAVVLRAAPRRVAGDGTGLAARRGPRDPSGGRLAVHRPRELPTACALELVDRDPDAVDARERARVAGDAPSRGPDLHGRWSRWPGCSWRGSSPRSIPTWRTAERSASATPELRDASCAARIAGVDAGSGRGWRRTARRRIDGHNGEAEAGPRRPRSGNARTSGADPARRGDSRPRARRPGARHGPGPSSSSTEERTRLACARWARRAGAHLYGKGEPGPSRTRTPQAGRPWP